MEKRFYIACIIIFGAFVLLGGFVTFKCLNNYKDSTVIVKSPCDNVESIGIVAGEDCSIFTSQKRENLNVYELFGKIQDDLNKGSLLFPIALVFLSLFMPCAYLREKKRIEKNLQAKELKENTYQYAYIPVVILPVVLSLIFFICGFVSNDYEVIYTTWNGNVLIYILMYYLLYVIASNILSLLIINTCLICAHKVHSYIGASLLSLTSLLILELVSKLVSILPSLSKFFAVRGVSEMFSYLLVPSILLVLSFLILRKTDQKEIAIK